MHHVICFLPILVEELTVKHLKEQFSFVVFEVVAVGCGSGMAGTTNMKGTVFCSKKKEDVETEETHLPEMIRARWRIVERIGKGGFGDIFQAFDTKEERPVAIKVERNSTTGDNLKMEICVLRRLQEKRHAARFYGCGQLETYKFVVMELLSSSLSELRRKKPDQRFTFSTSFRIGLQALEAVREVHSIGFLHRDVKPSNFAMGRSDETRKTLYIFDFGLAREYMSGREMRRPRSSCGFRGTTRYASLTTHKERELGRADDIQSLFYSMIELARGRLPWRHMRDKEDIGRAKEATSVETLTHSLPIHILEFGRHLDETEWLEAPDYDLLAGLLRASVPTQEWNQPFDWE